MKHKYLILFAAMILVAMVFFYFSSQSINAKIVKIKKYDKRIKVEQERLNSAKVLNEQLKQVSQVIYNSITTDKNFSPEEVNKFTKELADLADKYKIAVHALFPKAVSNAETHFLKQQYTMELVCTYVQLGKFLSDLESFNHIIKVKTLEVQPLAKTKSESSSTENNETRYKVTLELSVIKILKEA
ncbi:MAG: hypothetical protein DRZ79_04725 [Candidatus Cloacimonadota bacterium]|nr:MAG: hypothetical protein DRZ79_04725 [Candidatus Cloacimonadota bacterium]